MSFIPGYHLEGNSPIELKVDPFLHRLFFQYVDDWILREAERWDDPWQFLLSVPGLPLGCYDFFTAGVSFLKALNRLVHIEYGGATIHRCLWDKNVEARAKGKPAVEKEVHTIIKGLLKHGSLVGDSMPTEFKSEAERKEVMQAIEIAEGVLRKKYGKDWRAKLQLKPIEPDRQDKEAVFMVHAWLSCGGKLGLCFYSDDAIADLMTLVFHRGKAKDNYGLGQRNFCYSKMRKRLGLEQLNYRTPTVRNARPGHGANIEIEHRTKKGWRKIQLDERIFLEAKRWLANF